MPAPGMRRVVPAGSGAGQGSPAGDQGSGGPHTGGSGFGRGSLSADFGSPGRVEWHLDNWRAWKRSGPKQGAWGQAAVGLSNGGASQDFDDMAEASVRRCAVIVDTLIHDLPAAQASAIHHAYLAAVFRFPRLDYVQCLAEARRRIGRGLAKKGVY